mmetsp:Transcript_96565/g.229894  ORF Transcript_96565/g.229894 Transcript_96565/m.229894 type:complete len:382 (-) Transcript_96565:343-1488(-)
MLLLAHVLQLSVPLLVNRLVRFTCRLISCLKLTHELLLHSLGLCFGKLLLDFSRLTSALQATQLLSVLRFHGFGRCHRVLPLLLCSGKHLPKLGQVPLRLSSPTVCGFSTLFQLLQFFNELVRLLLLLMQHFLRLLGLCPLKLLPELQQLALLRILQLLIEFHRLLLRRVPLLLHHQDFFLQGANFLLVLGAELLLLLLCLSVDGRFSARELLMKLYCFRVGVTLLQVRHLRQLAKLLYLRSMALLKLLLLSLDCLFCSLVCVVQQLSKLLGLLLRIVAFALRLFLPVFEFLHFFLVCDVSEGCLLLCCFKGNLLLFRLCLKSIAFLLQVNDFAQGLLLNLFLLLDRGLRICQALSQDHWPAQCRDQLPDQLSHVGIDIWL